MTTEKSAFAEQDEQFAENVNHALSDSPVNNGPEDEEDDEEEGEEEATDEEGE